MNLKERELVNLIARLEELMLMDDQYIPPQTKNWALIQIQDIRMKRALLVASKKIRRKGLKN